MIEVQCSSCHTRYRIDEQVLPEGLPTFKCSRCGHVFSFEPRKSRFNAQSDRAAGKPQLAAEPDDELSRDTASQPEEMKPESNRAGRKFNAESAPSSPDSSTAGPPGFSDPSSAGAAPDQFQPESLKTQKPAAGKAQTEPGRLDPQRSSIESDAPQSTTTPQSAPSPQLAAEQARRFYSRLFTGKDPDGTSGENLSFDFADEQPVPEQTRFARRGRRQTSTPPEYRGETPQWQVGDDDSTPTIASSGDRDSFSDEQLSKPTRRQLRAGQTEPQFTDDEAFIDEEQAPVYNRARTHSSRFFVLLIFLLGVGFGALTLLIQTAPSTSAAVLSYLPMLGDRFATPATPAKLVAVRDVNGFYQQGKAGPKALVISGIAENVGTASLRIVQLTARLRDAQRRSLASQAVYCGNNVSPAIVSQMTPHEIEFLQRLQPGQNFALAPSTSCRFVAVFMNPPDTAHVYDISVSRAVAGTAPDGEEPGS